jgi:replication fork clamp-binding protein CrfC
MAEGDHGHEHKEASVDHDEHDEHDEHGSDGFKLNDTSIKNFELTYVDYKTPGTSISSKAIFRSLSEVNIYRVRAGLFKRIDFKTLEKNKDIWKVSSPDLVSGDKIVVSGIGFLRIAEIAASGGLSDSHSH